jgi:hypothetical protein
MQRTMKHGTRLTLCASFLILALASAPAYGQQPTPPPRPPTPFPTIPRPEPESQGGDTQEPQPETGETISLLDSSVGYIDSAIPATQFRLRYDAAYDGRRSTRAEFFYAKTSPTGPGLPQAERRIDYQDVMGYLEFAPSCDFSVFVEMGERNLNPEVNDNHHGLADMNAGFKYALIQACDTVATFQLRGYFPTGDAHKGLGTNHYSIEPALLWYQRLNERLSVESEFHYWIPIDGTDFAGEVLRYGVGLHYDILKTECRRITPVVEVVGWTVLDGKEAISLPGGAVEVKSASRDTIVNLKLGCRFGISRVSDLYVGYGRALTGSNWYEDIVRIEWRLLF